jgi:hypothetical protein
MKAYFRRLLPMTLIAFCFLALITLSPPSDGFSRLMSGSVSWQRTAAMFLILVGSSLAAAAVIDWGERRKARKSSAD